jgi:hypothetical protein
MFEQNCIQSHAPPSNHIGFLENATSSIQDDTIKPYLEEMLF